MSDRGTDVFVSYRREDGAVLAEALAAELSSGGFGVFFDKRSIRGGSHFPEEIRRAVSTTREFVALVTPAYLGEGRAGVRRAEDPADWVHQELVGALEAEGVHVIPVVVDGAPPTPEELPPALAGICELSCIEFDTRTDTIDLLVDQLKHSFCQETLESALVGSISRELDGVNPNDDTSFNVACKAISVHVKTDRDLEALRRILGARDSRGDYRYADDHRFAAFYTLFSYYRRSHRTTELVELVEAHRTEFNRFHFFSYAATECCSIRATLAIDREERLGLLARAVEYARDAAERLPNNAGIQHSFCLVVVTALEDGLAVSEDDLDRALSSAEELVVSKPDYARYQSTYARLLARIGRFDEALARIGRAIALEEPSHQDWALRVASYYRDEVVIRLARAEAQGALATRD